MDEMSVKNIIITRDAPLIVNDPSAEMHYGTVYMCMGAYIEIRAGAKFEIDKLQKFEDIKAWVGREPESYPTLSGGERLRAGSHHIVITGTPGKHGKHGSNGSDWGQGGERGERGGIGGNAASEYKLIIRDLLFDAMVLNVGGSGGNGGNGGNGANGFDGEDSSKPGGIGGDGGKGGDGGNSGDGASVTVRYASSNKSEISVQCEAAPGGTRGEGGIHGRNGKYYAGGTSPIDGTPGNYGMSGKKGSYRTEPYTPA